MNRYPTTIDVVGMPITLDSPSEVSRGWWYHGRWIKKPKITPLVDYPGVVIRDNWGNIRPTPINRLRWALHKRPSGNPR